jgi:serine/threonine protein kinase
MIGETIHNYVITSKIGEGGMGTVYLADDLMLDRQVAIKVLHPRLVQDEMLMERFKNEAKTLARLNHPNITTLYSLVQHGTSLCMVLEYVDGTTLEGLLSKHGALPPELAANLASQVLDGLHYAHNKDIIHRDIKPANLMVTHDGKVKIMDFGIARVMGSSRSTRVGTAIGTLEYMSPEQIRSEEVTPKSDIYSLGIVLYEMLSGQVPFKGVSEFNLMQSQINLKPTPLRTSLPNIPDALNNAVLKALEKDPGKRFPSAPAFRQTLSGAVPRFLSLADFEATRLTQPKETQILTSFNNPGPTHNRPNPIAASPKWWEKIVEDGNTAKKIFFIAAAVIVLLLMLELVCSKIKDKPEVAEKEPEAATTIAPTVYPSENIVQNLNNSTAVQESTVEQAPDESTLTSGSQNTRIITKETEKPGTTKPSTKSGTSKLPAQQPKQEPPKTNQIVTPVTTPTPEIPKPEQPKPEAKPQPVKTLRTKTITIPANKRIKIAPRNTLDSEKLKVGETVYLEVTAQFYWDGIVLIERGASVRAEVKEIDPRKIRASHILIELKSVETVDKEVFLDFYDPIIKIGSKDKFTTWEKSDVREAELKKYRSITISY